MNADRNYKVIQEDRDWYYVEYRPLRESSALLAGLNIVVSIEQADKNEIIGTMEKELKVWLARYPVPLSVSAWNNKSELYNFDEIKRHNQLVGFLDKNGKVCLYWGSDEKIEIPYPVLSQETLHMLYSDLEYITDHDYKVDQKKRRKQIIIGGKILYVIIPLIILLTPFIYESIAYFNNKYSNLFSFLSFVWLIGFTVKGGIRIAGGLPKSKKAKEREEKQQEEERLKDHYYYYCQLNPEGFRRLKLEALQQGAKSDIAKEAAALKNTKLNNRI
jgi:hypothetical protein